VYLLWVTTERASWQFGFNPWSRIGTYLRFPVSYVRVRAGERR
jgi:hypothetical protein